MMMYTEEAPIKASELIELVSLFIQLDPANRIRALGHVSVILDEQTGADVDF